MAPLVGALAAAGLFAPFHAHAATIAVATGGDAGGGGTCTLRQAVVSLNAGSIAGTGCVASGPAFGTGDTVDLTTQSGTITLGGTQVDVNVSMLVNGPGAATLTISGNNASRVFDVTGASAQLRIDNVTIEKGQASGSGGCLRSLPSGGSSSLQLQLNGAIVRNCTATQVPLSTTIDGVGFGGGIAAAVATLSQSTVSGNTAGGGGGIFAIGVSLTNSVVTGNNVTGGACNPGGGSKYNCLGGGGILAGGVYALYSTISSNTVHASLVTSGQTTNALGLGAGITVLGYGATAPAVAGQRAIRGAAAAPKYGAYLAASTVSNNTITGPGTGTGPPKYLGGGVFGYATLMANSTISGNSVGPNGYGAALVVGGMLAHNSTIAGNTGFGGIIQLPIAGSNPTVAAAIAQPSPVATWLRRGATPGAPQAALPFELQSTIVANTVGGGSDIECLGGSCTVTGDHNLVRTSGSGVTLPPDTKSVNPLLGPLADNGGIVAGAPGGSGTGHVRTHLLLDGSPAIDAGSNPDNFKLEQRGPGFPRVVGPAPNIGATEGNAQRSVAAVPALGPWSLAALSALVGALGWRRRRR